MFPKRCDNCDGKGIEIVVILREGKFESPLILVIAHKCKTIKKPELPKVSDSGILVESGRLKILLASCARLVYLEYDLTRWISRQEQTSTRRERSII